jgi:hypothetical protein
MTTYFVPPGEACPPFFILDNFEIEPFLHSLLFKSLFLTVYF